MWPSFGMGGTWRPGRSWISPWIDRMSLKYVGQLYQRRSPRELFTIEIDRVGHSGSWGG